MRFYSPEYKKEKLSEDEIRDRVLKVCASYDKVTAEKVDAISICLVDCRDS